MAKEGLGQHHTHLLVVRDVSHLLIVLLFLHTEVLQQLCGFALGLPAIHLGKSHFQLGSAVAVLLGHGILGIESLTLLHVLPKGLMSHQHGIHHREGIIFEVVLLQHAQALARAQLHRALVGFQLAADGAQQRRFTGTIGTNNAIDIVVGELQVHVLVECLLTKLDGQVCECYHLDILRFES